VYSQARAGRIGNALGITASKPSALLTLDATVHIASRQANH